ncbi:MAG: HU family DNA-binding protein [Sulfurimonas sp.]|nr:HU family DNA-binding protein [Sulfurimonas sp.]
MKNINKKDLSALSGVSVENIEAIFTHIALAISKKDNVFVSSFGTFSSVIQKGRSGTIPGTDKKYSTNDKMVPKFKAAKGLKDFISK